MLTARLRERSSARPTSRPVSSGKWANLRATRSSSTATITGSMTRQPVECGNVDTASSPCHGRRTSPSPSSSAPNRPSIPTRRISSPRRTMSPIPSRITEVCSPLHCPRGMWSTGAMHASTACSRTSNGTASARSGSSRSTWQTVADVRGWALMPRICQSHPSGSAWRCARGRES